MSNIVPNVIISMPSQLFTLARKFQAASNGKIFIGKIDSDPTLPQNQVQVYVENEDGSHVPVSQPIIINAAGYPVYNGQIAKFVTVQGHSMAVYDAYGAQQFYFPNVLKYDPDQLEQNLISSTGSQLIGTNHRGTLQADLDAIDVRTSGRTVSQLQAYGKEIMVDSLISSRITVDTTTNITASPNGVVSLPPGDTGVFIKPAAELSSLNGIAITAATPDDPTSSQITVGVLNQANKVTIKDSFVKDGGMGVSLSTGTEGTKLIFNRFRNMSSNNAAGAGGYGVLFGGNTDTLIIGQSSYGTNPQDRHAIYLSDNASNLVQNKDTRVIGCWGDYSGAINGGKPEQTAPMVFGRGAQGAIHIANQFRNGGSGIRYTDERQAYDDVFISNVQLNAITATDSTNFDCVGIDFISPAARTNTNINVNNVKIAMAYKSGNTGSRTWGMRFSGVRYLNVSSAIISSTGINPAIALDRVNYATIRDIVSYVNDGNTSQSALISFTGACSNIFIDGLIHTGRIGAFSGLSNVSDMTVGFPRRVRVTVVSGSATVTDPWDLVASVNVTASSITVNWKSHVTQNAADTACIRPVTSHQIYCTSTATKSNGCVIYTPQGGAIAPNTSTFTYDIVLTC